jgi:phosphate acetyltransferase
MMDFLEEILDRAKNRYRKIVFPEGLEPRILHAVEILNRGKILQPVLLGNPDDIRSTANSIGADLGDIPIINPQSSGLMGEFSHMYFQLRQHKGVTEEEAAVTMRDFIYFGTALVKSGEVDGYLAGSVTTTAKTVQAGLRILKTCPGVKKMSSFFFMVFDDDRWGSKGVLSMADPAIVVDMDAETMAEIAVMTAKNVKNIAGFEPRVAMLSYSTLGSGSGTSVDMVRRATELARNACPEFAFEGEIQADAAIVPRVADIKAPGNAVAGKANVLIFPSIDAANIGYKLSQRLSGAKAIGPMLQGLSKPANDLSRGCSIDDIVYTAAITALQA